MTSELSQALDTQILDANRRMIEAFAQGSDRLLAAANARRECGLLLLERKRKTPHGDWIQLFSGALSDRVKDKSSNTAVFPFDATTARRYMALAKDHPEEFTDFAEVMRFQAQMGRDAGLLPEPEHNQQTGHNQSFGSILITVCGKFESAFKKYDADDFLNNISDEGKVQLLDQLTPAKERLDRIYARLQEA